MYGKPNNVFVDILNNNFFTRQKFLESLNKQVKTKEYLTCLGNVMIYNICVKLNLNFYFIFKGL
jgi:hypothetical protein